MWKTRSKGDGSYKYRARDRTLYELQAWVASTLYMDSQDYPHWIWTIRPTDPLKVRSMA